MKKPDNLHSGGSASLDLIFAQDSRITGKLVGLFESIVTTIQDHGLLDRTFPFRSHINVNANLVVVALGKSLLCSCYVMRCCCCLVSFPFSLLLVQFNVVVESEIKPGLDLISCSRFVYDFIAFASLSFGCSSLPR